MAKIEGLKLSESEVSQTLDLGDLFGSDATISQSLKERIGQDIVNTIVERTESGKSVNGGNLKTPYSKAYAESDDFQSANKSRGRVNMKLTGDMLGLLDFEIVGDKIKVGWDDATENAKAYNHNVGDTVPKRPFFGLNQKELNALKEKYESKVKRSRASDDIDPFTAQILELIRRARESRG